MKKISALAVFLIFSVSFIGAQNQTIDYNDVNKKLFEHFEVIVQKSHRNRMGVASFLAGLGVTSVVTGAVIALSPASNTNEARMFGYGIMAGGGLLVGVSIPLFIIPSYQERKAALVIANRSENDRDQYQYLDTNLKNLASTCQKRRLLASGVMIGLGIENVLWGGPLVGATLAVGGLIPLFIESPAETEWKRYVRYEKIVEVTEE